MTAPGPRRLALVCATARWADHGYEGSRFALGIGELLTSAASASATLDRS